VRDPILPASSAASPAATRGRRGSDGRPGGRCSNDDAPVDAAAGPRDAGRVPQLAITTYSVLIGLAIAVVVYAAAIAALWLVGRRSAAREVAALVPNLAMLFRALLRDPRVPRGSKILVAVAIAWIVSPIDLIPEFIPVLGPLDDAVIAALVLRHVLRTVDRGTILEHWRGDPRTIDRLLRGFSRRRR
jgi:uncharacterized membrane protein YkvA (DUF1232 family)